MILQVIAAFDKKARAFMQPFYAAHVDVAIRSFGQAANTAEHQVHNHPEDFALYYLGTFNDENAQFTLAAQPQHLAEAIQLKKGALDVQSKGA